MASFHAGKVECRLRACEVENLSLLDFTAQFPSLFCLLGAERFLSAQRMSIRRSTEEVRNWVDSLTLEDLHRREIWLDPRWWALCEVESNGSILPIRSTYSGRETEAPTIGWNHVTTEFGLTLPYMLADVVAAKLLYGKTPKIVQSTTFEPLGAQQVRAVKVLGVQVLPGEGLIQTLAEARIREKRTPTPGSKNRAEGLKTICNAGSYGIFVEVNRKDRRGRVRIHGLGGEPFEWEDSEIEELGSDYFPLVGAALTSASHLLLAMVEIEVTRLGGRMVYCDTDSAFVTPSNVGDQVGAAFAGLNPYREETAFLKDEAETKAPTTEYPKECQDSRPRFFGLSSKRYCLFVRDRKGRPHVFRKAASDHGLGSYQVGGDREEWVAQLWEGIIEKGEIVSEEYAGVPATSEFSLSSPNLLSRVRQLGDIRPFTFLTARLLEPSSDPDEPRSELLAFIGPEDHARRAELMHRPRQRSWGSVVEDFVGHTDRKYTFDSEGLAVRRLVLARARNLVGLGKEANRIEDSRVLGLRSVGGRAKRYSDVEGRVLGMGRAEAKRLGIPWSTVTRWKRRIRKGRAIEDGHGGKARERAKSTLTLGPG
jgi:hypothetical protein